MLNGTRYYFMKYFFKNAFKKKCNPSVSTIKVNFFINDIRIFEICSKNALTKKAKHWLVPKGILFNLSCLGLQYLNHILNTTKSNENYFF